MSNNESSEFISHPILLRHATRPIGYGRLAKPYSGKALITGPCGDTMDFEVLIENDRVQDIAFITDGCGSSIAAGSMTVSLALGRPLKKVLALKQKDVLDALVAMPEHSHHCALLAVNTLHEACRNHGKSLMVTN